MTATTTVDSPIKIVRPEKTVIGKDAPEAEAKRPRPSASFLQPPSEEAFGEMDFLPAPELVTLANDLRRRHRMTAQITIDVLWKKKGGKHQGKETMGYCAKTSGLAKHYSGFDFVIWLAADHCREFNFWGRRIEAMLFHELHHADADEKGKPIVVAHDFEGFRSDLSVYGLWNPDWTSAKAAFVQAELFKP